jgi:hypothetical protein
MKHQWLLKKLYTGMGVGVFWIVDLFPRFPLTLLDEMISSCLLILSEF